MGNGASMERDLQQVLTCTLMMSRAMMETFDPKYMPLPDMYRLYDFHIGQKKHKKLPTFPFQKPGFVLTMSSDGTQMIQTESTDTDRVSENTEEEDIPNEEEIEKLRQEDKILLVQVDEDEIMLNKDKLATPNEDGWTPLHACCHMKFTSDAGCVIINELVKQAADLNIQTTKGPGSLSTGWTPLHIATAYGLETLVYKLLKAGANPNVTNSIGWTPLHEACHRGYAELAQALVSSGASIYKEASSFPLSPFPGQLPLAEASRQGHLSTVEQLLELGANIDATNEIGWTALHEAAYHNREPVVKALMERQCKMHLKTNDGKVATDLTVCEDIKALLGKKQEHTGNTLPMELPTETYASNGEKEVDMINNNEKNEKGNLQEFPHASDDRWKSSATHREMTIHNHGLPSVDMGSRKVENCERETLMEGANNDTPEKRNRKGEKKHKDIPKEFQCEITHKLMEDSVRTPFGNVFDRGAFQLWTKTFGNRCPITGEPLVVSQLIADETLNERIKQWKITGKYTSSVPTNPNITKEVQANNEEAVDCSTLADDKANDHDDLYDF